LQTALIADDSASIRTIVGFTLRTAGFQVIEGVDGQDGLRKLEHARVDLIITDLNMLTTEESGLRQAAGQSRRRHRLDRQARAP